MRPRCWQGWNSITGWNGFSHLAGEQDVGAWLSCRNEPAWFPFSILISALTSICVTSAPALPPLPLEGARLPCITHSYHPLRTPAFPRQAHQRYWNHLASLITCLFPALYLSVPCSVPDCCMDCFLSLFSSILTLFLSRSLSVLY